MSRTLQLLSLACCLGTVTALAQSATTTPGSNGFQINGTPTLTTDPAVLFPAAHDVVLNSGDLVAVRIFGQAEYTPSVRIGTDGAVDLPLIGVVKLQGLTITAAEQLIAQRLEAAGMYRDPQVTLSVVEGPSSVATVLGESHGLVPIVGSRRLMDVLAGAGGLPPSASHIITIQRPGVAQPIVVDLGTNPTASGMGNIPVFPGDTILVARTGVVYVVGSFHNQGAVPISQTAPLTLLQATALSGGPNFDAKYDDLHLIRTIGNQRQVVKLDIKKVLHGEAPDPVLQADDILYLPNSALKSALQNGSASLITSALSLTLTAIDITRR